MKKIVRYLPYILTIILIIAIYQNGKFTKRKLTQDGIIIVGKVTECYHIHNARVFEYEFYIENKRIKGGTVSVAFSYPKMKILKNKKQNFSILFSKSDPSNNQILLSKEDFSEYGYSFPDSMKKICEFLELKECK